MGESEGKRKEEEGKKEGRIKSSVMDQILYMQFLIALKDTQGYHHFLNMRILTIWKMKLFAQGHPTSKITESHLNSSL